MYFYRKDKRQTALFKEKVIALYELLFVMMRVALESTFQLHADKMKMRKWKSDCTMSRKTQARAYCLDMRRATRDTRNESRATGHGPRVMRCGPYQSIARAYAYARMHVSRAHTCTHSYMHTCNAASGTVCSARETTMKLRPWYMMLPVVLELLSMQLTVAWFIFSRTTGSKGHRLALFAASG